MIVTALPRRRLLAAVAAAAAGAAIRPAAASQELMFRIVRKGSVIGNHVVSFQRDGERMTVRIVADIAVGLGPITLFRYRHRASALWEGNTFVALDAETNDNGTMDHARMRRDRQGLVVEGSQAPRFIAPAGTLPATHWNRKMLDGPMVNTQHGQLMQTEVTLLAAAPAGVKASEAFRVRGDAEFDTYYDATKTWVGLSFTAKDGSAIRYERI